MSASSTGIAAVGEVDVNSAPTPSRAWSDPALTALAPMIWGSTYLVTTDLLPPDRPITAACLRTLPAGLALILLQRRKVPVGAWPRLALYALLNIGLFQVLLFAAAYRLPGGIAAIVGALMPLLVMALAWLFDQRRPGLTAVSAAMIAVLGMLLIFGRPSQSLDRLGLLAAAAGTICLAFGTYLTGRNPLPMPLLVSSGWQLTLAGLALAPVAYAFEPGLPAFETKHLAGYAYLAIPGALVSYPLWFRGIRQLSATAVSALGLLSPLTALLLGWWFRNETFAPLQLVGMAGVLAAVLLLQRKPSLRLTHSTPCQTKSIS